MAAKKTAKKKGFTGWPYPPGEVFEWTSTHMPKPVVLLSDAEIMARFPIRDAATVIAERNAARDVAVALANASMAAKIMRPAKNSDLVELAGKQLRTRFDGQAFGRYGYRIDAPIVVRVWFENLGPIHEPYNYDEVHVFDNAVASLEGSGYKQAIWESENAAMVMVMLYPEIWA